MEVWQIKEGNTEKERDNGTDKLRHKPCRVVSRPSRPAGQGRGGGGGDADLRVLIKKRH